MNLVFLSSKDCVPDPDYIRIYLLFDFLTQESEDDGWFGHNARSVEKLTGVKIPKINQAIVFLLKYELIEVTYKTGKIVNDIRATGDSPDLRAKFGKLLAEVNERSRINRLNKEILRGM